MGIDGLLTSLGGFNATKDQAPFLPLQKQMNWCNDKRLIDKYETKDPSKPGIYIMKPAEAKALSDAMGDAHKNYVYSTTPDDANVWVDKFHKEAAALVAA